jgi:hypothetical protein
MNSTQIELGSRWTFIKLGLTLALLIPSVGHAEDPKLDTKAQQKAPTAFAAEEPKHVLHWGVDDGKSYFVPAYEIIGFEFALNRFDHYVIDDSVYGYPTSNLKQNLSHSWVTDNDKYSTNQFLHPYQGCKSAPRHHKRSPRAGDLYFPAFVRSATASLMAWNTFGTAMPLALSAIQLGIAPPGDVYT